MADNDLLSLKANQGPLPGLLRKIAHSINLLLGTTPKRQPLTSSSFDYYVCAVAIYKGMYNCGYVFSVIPTLGTYF